MGHVKFVSRTTPPETEILAEAFEYLESGLCVVDGKGAVQACNGVFRELLGLPDAWPDIEASAVNTASAAQDLITGWCARVKARGDFNETVALSPQTTVRVRGKALPSGGVSLSVVAVREADRREPSDWGAHQLVPEALNESDARLRAIADNANALIMIKGLDRRFQFVGKGFSEAYGVAAEEAIGKTSREIKPRAFGDLAEAQDRRVVETGTPIQEEVETTFADGSQHTLLVTKFPIRDEDGNIVGVGAINADITELVAAREELANQDTLLRAVIDHAEALFALKDTEGRFVLVSSKFEEWYGIAADEAVGKTSFELASPEEAEIWSRQDRSVCESGTDIKDEVTVPFADGTTHTLLVSKFPVRNAAGEIIGVGAINTDITDRVADRRALAESEAKFRTLIENLPDSLSLKDREGKFVLVNPTWQRNLAIQAQNILGKTIWDAFPDMDWSRSDANDARLLAGVSSISEDEVAIDVPHQGRRVFRSTKFPVLDSEGNPTGIGTITSDITDLIEGREELRRSEAGLLYAQKLARIGNWEKNFVTGEVYWSDQVFEILGIEKQPVPNFDKVLDYIHPDDRQKLRDKLAAIFAGAGYHDLDFRVVTASGDVRYVHELSEVEFDDDGKPVRCVGVLQDVTEARLADEALRESEQRFRSLVDNLPNAVSLKDADQRFVLVNKTFERLFGHTEELVAGRSVLSVMPDHDNWQQIIAADDAILRGERNGYDERLTLKFPDNVERIFEIRKFPVTDGAGKVVGVGTISTDTTERVAAERALRKSEASLNNAQRIAHLGNWDWDIVNNTLYWSDEIYNIFGLKGREFGESYEAFLSSVHPDDRDFVKASVEAALNEGKPYSIDHRIVLPGDEIRVVHEQGEIVYDAAGHPIQMNGTVQDVTEQREAERALRASEERFRAFVDNLPGGLALKDADHKVLFVNGRLADWYGVPADELIGKIFPEVVVAPQNPEFFAAQQKVLESGEALETEITAVLADGAEHHLHTVIFPVETGDGRQLNVGTLSFDVTDRKRTEDMLRQAQKMQAVGQLTGGVAHDFNNLLAVVIGNLELIAGHFVDRAQQDSPVFNSVRQAFAAAERGASLTHHLLAFARQQVLQPEVLDLGRLIGETKELMSVSMGEKISVTLDCDDNLWRCTVDGVQLQNAILNLAINARDAMSSCGNLAIRTENVHIDSERAAVLEMDEGDYVCLSVSDDGSGIPDEILEHVYEPFFTTKEAGQGSGLGLSMVYGFVRQSGGSVDIETDVGRGTTVRLYFPAAVDPATPAAEGKAQAKGDCPEREAKILLVEDNRMFRDVTREILESANFRVVDTGTAEEALEEISAATHFDLLLSDIGLPGAMDGHALAQFAASARPGLKIVLMSAHTDRVMNGAVVDHNVAAFLRKPHRKAELLNTLRRVLKLDS